MASVERDFEATARRMLATVPACSEGCASALRGDIARSISASAFRAPECRGANWSELSRAVSWYFRDREPNLDWEHTLVDILTGRLPEGAVVIDIRSVPDADLGDDD